MPSIANINFEINIPP